MGGDDDDEQKQRQAEGRILNLENQKADQVAAAGSRASRPQPLPDEQGPAEGRQAWLLPADLRPTLHRALGAKRWGDRDISLTEKAALHGKKAV